MLGILVNVYCHSEEIDSPGNMSFAPIILGNLMSDDPGTLIQVVRLLQGVIWRLMNNEESLWLTYLDECNFSESIIYILLNSTNCTLSCNVMYLEIILFQAKYCVSF